MYISRCGVFARDGFEGEDFAMSLLSHGRFGATASDLSPGIGADDWADAMERDQHVCTDRFVSHLPEGRGDYPLRSCYACGLWSAPSGMSQVDGFWFHIDCAPEHVTKPGY